VGTASKVVVLDTWALLAYLDGEPAASRVRQTLRSARRRQLTALLSLISFGECLYVIEREQGMQRTQRAIGIVDQLALRVMPVDRPLVFEAAHLKARYPISYADAFSAALAKRHQGHVMTGDPEFKVVESEVPILWLNRRRTR
jgi:predicted nucleic acid-binding protein